MQEANSIPVYFNKQSMDFCLNLTTKKDDIIFFDEFSVPTHEFKAFHDFIQSYYTNLELIAAANNYYFVAFKVT